MKLLKRLREFGDFLRSASQFAKELSAKGFGSVTWLVLDQVWCRMFYGASQLEYRFFHFYTLRHMSRDSFITNRRWIKMWSDTADKAYVNIFRHKSKFAAKYSEFFHREWLFAPDSSDEQILEFIRRLGTVFAKPHAGSLGAGIHKVSEADVTDIASFCKNARENEYIFEEVVKQHPKMNELNPAMVNTSRVYTLLDRQGAPHIVAAFVRCGHDDAVVDNAGAGGLFTIIDTQSGILRGPAMDLEMNSYLCHPRTGTILPGFQIPLWEEVCQMVLKAALVVPQVRYVGWDVAITEKGPLLIEGNSRPDHHILQMVDQKGRYHQICDML